ncbi:MULTISPECIES: phosphopentomutase [unclassified Serratia (in: enterobacteria)]|uniref:phosphopentomutase n=1 Tax=unclassified Serratia (in: enterobacteria) TaxID=2647522 RepID=UPI0005045127|nr:MULTISPECIES: phosphopentomutase [unclassified Serratia (in: enterobacteria)]KFK94370.1 mutase [Serratia sp. Ag2]KFK99505.1 mutase [Serratia sp. Ag1]
MAKFLVLVIDSFGVGAMEDVAQERPQDMGANTCGHILQAYPEIRLPTLERLGLINALGFQANIMQPCASALFGTANLQHEGGDTFMGHQEIMGTQPQAPLCIPFSSVIDSVEAALQQAGYSVMRIGERLQYLWVNEAVAVGDNIEADPGLVFNVTANLTQIPFDEVKKIGRMVREQVKVARVIAFGGLIGDNQRIHRAAESRQDQYIGINAPASGAYEQGFQVQHMGYGVDAAVQVPQKLHQVGISTVLIGKVADIVDNPHGTSYQDLVDSQTILDITLAELQKPGDRFICTNIQETDLAGHAQSVERYLDRLQLVDGYLEKILLSLAAEDCLIVTADHGNDPTIGHSKHTREKVPLLVYRQGASAGELGLRSTLSDIGATVCDFFHAPAPQNGRSFLPLIRPHDRHWSTL